MIVSILLPTRKRFVRLLDSVRSFYETDDPTQFEILLGVDSDDDQTLANVESFGWYDNITIDVAPRPARKYLGIHEIYDRLAQRAKAPWVWIWNDDVTLSGRGWSKQLKQIPLKKALVHPQIHQLNQSVYQHDEGGPFPIYPKNCWKQLGWAHMPSPVDTAMNDLMKRSGWQVHFLSGIGIHHQRDSEAQLEAHRQ